MQKGTAKKLNPYIAVPPSLLGGGNRHFPFCAIVVGGLINSYSGKLLDNGELSNCTRTKVSMCRELGVSYSSAWRAVKRLIDDEKIKPVESKQNTYIFNNTEPNELFIRIDKRLLNSEFDIYDEETKQVKERRKLTRAEAAIGGLIITRCDNKNHAVKVYFASNQDIADELGISVSTVDPAIKVLKAAKIIVRKSEDVGVNRFKKSKYSINRKFRRIIEQKQKEEQATTANESSGKGYKTFAEKEAERLEQIARRENKYYDAKHAAEEAAERNYARAMSDARFRAAEKELKVLDIEVAKAEVKFGAVPKELQARHKQLIQQRREALKQLGLTEKDLTVPNKYLGDARGSPGKV